MRVVYTRSAITDIEQISSYIRDQNPQSAVAVADAVESTAMRIGMFPLSASATDEPGVRMAPAGRFPYLLLFTVRDDEVLILRIMHSARMRPWERPANESSEEN